MFAALLDTCVLWPSLQRDFLLSLAVQGMYRPLWSRAVLTELERTEIDKLTDRHGLPREEAEARARRVVAEMRREFDDAEVHGWEPLEGSYGLPDPGDEHLVAAAFVGGAGAIVTDNHKDLPTGLLPRGIQRIPPHEFAFNTVAVDPVAAWRAVVAIEARSGRKGPVRTAEDILNLLISRYDMSDAVSPLRQVR